MDVYVTEAIVPAATSGNLTNLVAERAWFEPERVMLSRPLGEGWQPVTAREFEEEVRAVAKGLIASGVNIGDRGLKVGEVEYQHRRDAAATNLPLAGIVEFLKGRLTA